MKNLKKILIALAVLALLVSSFTVLVVTADDEIQYTGDLAKAQELLDDVPSMDRTDSTTDLRKEAIKKVYNYIRQYPIDPETEGYEEFEAAWYDMSLKILNKYYDKLTAATAKADKQKHLTSVYSYIGAFPIPAGTPDPDGEGEEYVSYDAIVEYVEAMNLSMMQEYYDAAAAKLADGDLINAKSNLESLYAHVESYPLIDSSSAGFTELYASYNLLSLQISEAYIANFEAQAENAETTGDPTEYKSYVQTNLSVLKEHIEKNTVDLVSFPELTERFDALTPAIHKTELAQITFLFDDYENFVADEETMPYPELAKAATLAKVSKALSDSTIPEETEGYSDLVDKIKAAEADLAAVKEQRRLELDAEAKLYEYSLTDNMYVKDFSSDDQTMGNPNADAGEYSERIKTYDNGLASGYEAYWRYTYSTGREGNTNYSSHTMPNITNGFVYSFDFMAEGRNGEHFKSASFANEWRNSADTRLVKYGKNEFGIAYDSETDSIKIYNVVKTGITEATVVKNIAAEGQWFNVMFTYDPTTHYGKLYVDYVYLFDIYFEGWVENATKIVVRASHSYDWQYVCFDNVTFYEGTSYRDLNKFSELTDNQKFIYNVEYFLDYENDVKSRNTAYLDAKLALEQMKASVAAGEEAGELNEELTLIKSLIEQFEAFDYDGEIVSSVKAQNLAEIVSRAEAISAMSANSETVSKINTEITSFESFIEENSEYIDKSTVEYNEAVRKISAVKENLAKVEYTKTFVRALVQFERATTVASMTRRATTANEVYALARYDRQTNRDFASQDPLFAEFEKTINASDAVSTDADYITVFDYYDMIPALIAEQTKVENSVRIIKCIELLLEMEGYENTEEFWLANYDAVEFYISIIRDIVSVDNYDPTYTGIDEALSQYELIDAYFYVLLQEEHIAIIGEQLDRFAASNSYIEKIGICTYLDRYFASNIDINLELEEIVEFQYRLERYKAELEIYMEDYKDLLERNTQYFIDTIKKMETVTTYAQLKPYYEEALGYYYAMNADTEEAKAAVLKFDEYDKKLRAVETNAELFIAVSMDLDYVDILGVETEFSMLSECAGYYEYVDATYSEQLAERMAKYEELVAKYNGAVDSASSSFEVASEVASALRAEQISASILAVINQLYEN